MRPRAALLILAVLLATPLQQAAGAAPEPQILTEQDRGRTLTLRPGQKLILNLRNPKSGGYHTYAPAFDPAVLTLVAQRELPPEAAARPRLGDFGQFYYEWEAVGAGETDIVICIQRPWEKRAPQEYWRVRVRVTP